MKLIRGIPFKAKIGSRRVTFVRIDTFTYSLQYSKTNQVITTIPKAVTLTNLKLYAPKLQIIERA